MNFKQWHRTSVFVSGLILCVSYAVAQPSAVLDALRDNSLYEDGAGAVSNGAGEGLFAGRTNTGSIRRALLAFDIAGVVPSGASIDSVWLMLQVTRTATDTRTISVHRVTSNWGEGESNAALNEGKGSAAMAGDATWLHTFYDDTFWLSPGGDFDNTPSATLAVGSVGNYRWPSTERLKGDVHDWLERPDENYGWLIQGDESTTHTAKRFGSREHTNASSRPTLHVFYSIPTGNETAVVPASTRLMDNYPNPFSRTTVISYELDADQPVELAVFDVLGRKIKTLVSSWQATGFHDVAFDADGLSDGFYLYRLNTSGIITTKGLLIVR